MSSRLSESLWPAPRLHAVRAETEGEPQAIGPSVFCRRCDSSYPRAGCQVLSAHATSGGVVTYFRCPLGHPDFFITGGGSR